MLRRVATLVGARVPICPTGICIPLRRCDIIRYGSSNYTEELRKIEDVEQWMQSNTRHTDLCNDRLTNFLETERHGLALKMYEIMKRGEHCKPDTRTYHQLLIHLGRVNPRRAMDLFQEMIESDVTPNVISYSILINIFRKSGQLNKVDLILAEMDKKGIPLNINIYTTLIDAYCKADKLEKATELLQRMQSEGISPSSYIYSSLIFYLCKIKNIPRALKMIEDLKQREGIEPNVALYNTVLSAITQESTERGLAFANKMESEGIRWDLRTYNTLIRAILNKKDSTFTSKKEALKMLSRMKSNGIKPDEYTYNTLLSGLPGFTGKFLYGMRKENIPFGVVTYGILIRNCSSNVEKVLQIAEQMKKDNVQPDEQTYNTIMSSLCKTRRFVEAKLLLEQMRENQMKPDARTFNNFISSYLASGDISSAHEMLQQMEDELVPRNAATFNILIGYFLKSGDTATVGALFEQMKDQHITHDQRTKGLVTWFNTLSKLEKL